MAKFPDVRFCRFADSNNVVHNCRCQSVDAVARHFLNEAGQAGNWSAKKSKFHLSFSLTDPEVDAPRRKRLIIDNSLMKRGLRGVALLRTLVRIQANLHPERCRISPLPS